MAEPKSERPTRLERTEDPRAPKKAAKSTRTEEPQPFASPGSGTRAQKLAQLLAAYKADKITPLEYHTERAKILAAP